MKNILNDYFSIDAINSIYYSSLNRSDAFLEPIWCHEVLGTIEERSIETDVYGADAVVLLEIVGIVFPRGG